MQEIRHDHKNVTETDHTFTYIYSHPNSYEPLAQCLARTDEQGNRIEHEVNYFHCDQIGIPREMTDSEGKLIWRGRYDAWGDLIRERHPKNTAGTHQPFRLQNQYYDEETGLHYNFLRYYDPITGRFTTQDPIGLKGGMNLYRFADNVQGWIDPLGLERSKRPCDEIEKDIDRLINRNKRCGKCGGTHGLRHRFDEQINGKNGPGSIGWLTHEQEIKKQQKNLRKYLNEWNDSGCGDPPKGAWQWATKPVPTHKEWNNPNKVGFSDYAELVGWGILTVGLFLVPFDGLAGEAASGAMFIRKASVIF